MFERSGLSVVCTLMDTTPAVMAQGIAPVITPPDTIQVNFTVADLEQCGDYSDSDHCLLATALHRLGHPSAQVWNNGRATIAGRDYSPKYAQNEEHWFYCPAVEAAPYLVAGLGNGSHPILSRTLILAADYATGLRKLGRDDRR